MKKPKATYQLLANLLMWFCVVIVIGGIAMAKNGSPTTPLPKAELLKLVEPAQLFMFLGAGLLFFLVLAFIRHKSTDKAEQDRAKYFADLGFDEMASSLFSFGSLLAVCVVIGAPIWYVLGSLACYGVGYYLKPE